MTKMMNRRMFLVGSGGAVMAIPFLPSLTSRAFAADPDPGPVGKCFFAVGTEHGAVWGENMYPNDAVLTQTMPYAGRNVRYGDLPTSPNADGKVVLSPMCSASAQLLTPSLAAKFNILRGIDIPWGIGHHTGGYLGNFIRTNGGISGVPGDPYMTATVDQFMAYSPSFYSEADLAAKMTQRSFCIGSGWLSWNFTNAAAKTGNVVSQPHHRNNDQLFEYLFQPTSSLYNVDQFIIDRVKKQYDRLKNHPRISKGDLARLNQHVERMFQIEQQIKVSQSIEIPSLPEHDCALPQGYNCQGKTQKHWAQHGGETIQTHAAWTADYCDLMTDVIVAAFSTGVCRVGTWYQLFRFNLEQKLMNDWHGQVGHEGFGAQVAQQWALAYNQGTFEHILVRLAAKMDAVDMGNGTTLLDNSLLMQTNEAGQVTHHAGCVNYPVVMAGGAGGYFKTGMFVDFGDTTHVYDDLQPQLAGRPGLNLESPGLYYNQFLANVLMSMGVPKDEWEGFTEVTPEGPKKSDPTKGYGFHYIAPQRAQDYAQAKLVMSDKLPVITNS
ncbi:MAG: DUF1552 domain-containing protein [Myxococcota bacterium]|nr:DUF1552 domain-containing protein [Myxococcota bacterium]